MEPDGTVLQGQRVLVAEDHFLIAVELTNLLHGWGCTVLGPVGSVAEAEALLDRGRPDLALLDLGLSDRANA
jgi:DNA-binding NarL/FixJ family response regulator